MKTFLTREERISQRLARKVRKLERRLARLDPKRDAALRTQLQQEMDLARLALDLQVGFVGEPPVRETSRTLVVAALLGLAVLTGLFLFSRTP
ncbi:hypothetical protein HNP48_002308 [Acidovorax soli]|uniref:Uncharacterized protein n=1 Tax=Acidovorax soli TaxID=592050 RepID=A0A7X0PDM8_9BURK|nr:hypothetical protein [Acidovorax soli]MBB6559641.1 hypothetical protein [Acidovorax soli]